MVDQLAYPLRVAAGRVDVMTRPAEEAITLDLAREHCRIDGEDEDVLLKGNIVAAREALEAALARPLLPQECRVR
ncbi:head-tail connector protein, partial [Burkholderia cenocepacia]